MPLFRYKAVAPSGELVEAETEASDRAAVAEQLKSLGHLPISIEARGKARLAALLSRDLFGTRPLSQKDLTSITRELATLLQAGLTLERSLEIVTTLGAAARVRLVLDQVLRGIREGKSLAQALGDTPGARFPPYYVSLVRAGETGGSLGLVLARLAGFLERSQAFRENLASALIYPAILVVMVVLSLLLLLTFVLPQFEPLFADAGEALPLPTRIVIAFGDLVGRFWWLFALAVLAAWIAIRRARRNPRFRAFWDLRLLRLPLVGQVILKLETARLTRTLGTLLTNGVPLLSAIAIAREAVGNSALAAALRRVETEVREGSGLAAPLARARLFPELAVRLTSIGEEAGNLDAMLIKLSEIYDQETQRGVQRLMTVLVPALTIGLGIVVAAIIGSILMAILSVNQLAL